MTTPKQSYARHRRWHPLFHFFVQPVLTANLAWQLWRLGADPSGARAWSALVAAALLALALSARHMALINQRRIIRMEERARLKALLPPELQGRVDELRLRHLISLRFASDDELPSLARRCLDGELRDPADIKRAIRNWRADTLRV